MSTADASGAIVTLARAVVPKTKGSHTKTLLLVGVLIGVGIYCAWAFDVEPFAGYLQPYMLAVTGFVKIFEADVISLANTAIKYAEANPIPAFLGGITMFGTVYGIYSKVAGDRALARTQALASEQISEVQGNLVNTSQNLGVAQTKITSLQEELDTYKNDTSFQEAQNMIGTMKSQVSQKEATIGELTKIIEDLKTKTQIVVH